MQASGGTRQSRDASATLSGSPNGVRCRFSQEQRVRGQHTRPPAACFARVRATGTGVVVLASSRPVAPLGNDLRTTTIRSVGGSPRNLDAHARGPSTTTPDYTTGLPRRAEPRRRIVVFLPRRGPAAGLRCLRLIAAGKFSGSGCNTPQQGRLERAQRFLQPRAPPWRRRARPLQERRPGRFGPGRSASGLPRIYREKSQGVEAVGCAREPVVHEVGVHAERHARVGVAGDACELEDVRPLRDQLRHREVAEVVKAERTHLRSLQRGIELPLQPAVRRLWTLRRRWGRRSLPVLRSARRRAVRAEPA
jgi:hypothetical protein